MGIIIHMLLGLFRDLVVASVWLAAATTCTQRYKERLGSETSDASPVKPHSLMAFTSLLDITASFVCPREAEMHAARSLGVAESIKHLQVVCSQTLIKRPVSVPTSVSTFVNIDVRERRALTVSLGCLSANYTVEHLSEWRNKAPGTRVPIGPGRPGPVKNWRILDALGSSPDRDPLSCRLKTELPLSPANSPTFLLQDRHPLPPPDNPITLGCFLAVNAHTHPSQW